MSGDIKRPHKHYYNIFLQVKNVFEPVDISASPTLYSMVEYSYMACSCGATVRSKVEAA